MEYKIMFSDKSFMYVDDTFKLYLFKNYKSKPIIIKIDAYEKFWHLFFRNYFIMDKISEDNEQLLSFSITDASDRNGLPYNTRLKCAQDVKVGDMILGPDGPRTVEDLHQGEEAMFEIEIDGKTYTVNEGHILHLIDKDDHTRTLDMQVGVYIHMTDEFKSHWVMEKVNV